MKIAPGLQALLTGRARVSEHLLGLTHPDVGEDVAAADVDPRLSASPLYSRTCVRRPLRPLTLSLSPFGGEGIEMAPSPSSIKRVGVRVAHVFTHYPG